MDLCTACALGLHDLVEREIRRKPINVLFSNEKTWTPIMYACAYCHEEIVSLLMDLVPASVYSINKQMQTPLMLSSKYGKLQIVKLLVKKNETLECKDHQGWTALFYAISYGHIDIAHHLIKNGANLNARDYRSRTVLMAAVEEAREDIVELLLASGADYRQRTKDGLKAIDIAFQLKHFKLVSLLSIPGVTDLDSLMRNLCLDKYTTIFKQNNIDFNLFLKLTEDDLKHLGISLLGPRRKISLAIGKLNYFNELKMQLQTNAFKC